MPGAEVTPEMIEAGQRAVAERPDADAIDGGAMAAAYTAMRAADPCFRAFAKETIYNIRGLMNDLARCERRAIEHFDRISAGFEAE